MNIEGIDIKDIEFGEPIEEREPTYRDGYIRGIYRARNIIDSKQKEIERLNNIINELDNWLGKKILSWEDDGNVSDNIYHERLAIQMIYFKLQELKGDDKNDKS